MKKSMLLILLVFVFASSSVLAGYPQGVTQKASAAKLQQASKTPLQLVFSSKTNIPRFATFRVKTQSPQSPETSAIEFFEKYKELFKISKASEELSLKNIHVDNLGMTHVKMRQMVQGIPVFGSEMIVHINKNNEIYAVNGEFMPQLEIADVTARLAPGTAIETAKSNIGDAVYRLETDYEKALPEGMSWRPEAELTIVQHEKAYRVAYKTMIATEEPITANWIYFVDAKTGEILNKYNDIKTSDAVGTGNSLYRGSVSINTNSQGANFEMKDNPRNLWTYDNNGRGDRQLPGSMFTDSDNVWGDGTANDPASAGVDAHWGAAVTYDYYQSNHGRNSVDGNGLRINSSVHYKRNLVNAYWNGAQMLYGDGDGSTATALVDLDVVAHELTHGVTQYTADLIYQNQSGALNESVSDIFAMLIDTDDFTIGEDSWLASPGYLRSMSNPGSAGQPNHMDDYYNTSGDNGGVHTNSGIPNFAAYLMSQGGSGKYGDSVTGIGRTKTGAIWYAALANYMTASTDFDGARTATVAAAEDIYGANSSEVQTVNDAWDAVGVAGSGPPPPDWTGTFVSHSYSTPHPYKQRKTYTHTITHPGATGMKVSFTNFATEQGWDFVSIKDGNGATVASYSGSLGDFVSAAVVGETITVELVADVRINDYGFDIDGYYYNSGGGAFGLASSVPEEFGLEQNYPNPFNPSTTISYKLAEASNVTLNIYDLRGRLVKTLVNGEQAAAQHTIVWDATNESGLRVSSGIYFYELHAGTFAQRRQMVLLK